MSDTKSSLNTQSSARISSINTKLYIRPTLLWTISMEKNTLIHFNINKYISRIRLRLGHRVRINFVSDIQ